MDKFPGYIKAWEIPTMVPGFFRLGFISLTNDEDRTRFLLHYLSEHAATVDIHRESKSADEATRYVEKANKKFSSKLWKSLLDMYTRAVVHAPPNSSELARAYANRSAVLYEEKLYEDSISDIERALDIGYPDERKAKLFVRKWRCLLALEREAAHKVADALAEARKWIATMDDTKREYMNNILREVPINSTLERISNEDYHKVIPQNFGDNPRMIGASSAIKINYSEKFGRHIRATRNINAGETILVHKAYASVIEPNFMLEYCWNCFRRAWAGVPCHDCIAVIYCSEACRDIAWNDYHSIECPVIPLLLKTCIPRMLMVLRLTVKAYKEAGTITKLRDIVTKIDAIRDPIDKICNGNMFDNSKYSSVYTLLRGSQVTMMDAWHCMMSLYCLGASTEIFGKRITKLQDLLNNKSAIFIGGLMLRHFRICSINSFGTLIGDATRSKYRVTMNPLINLFNHSCNPTAGLIEAEDVIAVVAIERIERGAQIYISYGPLFWGTSIEDRRQFCEAYNFICECKPCTGGLQLPSGLLPPSHQLVSSADKLKLMNSLAYVETLYLILPAMNIGEIYSQLLVVSNMMNVSQHDSEYSISEFVALKVALLQLLHLICTKFQLDRRSNTQGI